MQTFDYIVVGLGTAGSATCMSLARRGFRVLGLDAHRPPHQQGSHHGGTRSIRRAYLEGSSYVPMAMESWELWRKLERDTGRKLLVETGNLTIGPPDCPAIQGFFKSAKRYDISHDFLSAKEIMKRWSPFTLDSIFVGGLEKEAGIVFTEPSITAFLEEAQQAGASLKFRVRVEKLSESYDDVAVEINGVEYKAGRLLVAAGAWTAGLLGIPGKVVIPQRVPVHWFSVGRDQNYSLGNFPVNFWQVPLGDEQDQTIRYREFYSLPTTSEIPLVKAAFHNGLAPCNPNFLDRAVADVEVLAMKNVLSRFIGDLPHHHVDSEVCMYTMTADGDFYLGKKPGSRNVFGAALAGHGFKFAPIIGEILADLMTESNSTFDVDQFSPDRFIV